MVLINIQRLIHLIQETDACPFGFPERQSLLWRAYSSYEETPDTEFVSISTNQDWRFLDERKLEEEDEECRKSIVQELVERFTRSKTTVPVLRTIIYLVPSAQICPQCGTGLRVVRPYRMGKEAVGYTSNGPQRVISFHKVCKECSTVVQYNYSDSPQQHGGSVRKFHTSHDKYFGVTRSTFFSIALLEEWTEDLFTLDTQFDKICVKYNRIHSAKPKLYKHRVYPAWAMYSISKRIPIEFSVSRDSSRNLNFEEAFKKLYPQLKEAVDKKWLMHNCSGCATRLVVMDGNMKVFRCSINVLNLIMRPFSYTEQSVQARERKLKEKASSTSLQVRLVSMFSC